MGARSGLEELLFVWDASLWKNLLGGSGHGVAISFSVPDRCDWGSARCWQNFLRELLMMDGQATSDCFKGAKNLKTKSLSLGGSSATDGLATPNLVWEDFFVQTWVWGPNMLLGDFSYPRLGWQVQACFGSFVLAKGRLGGEGETEIGKSFVPKDGFKGPSMNWGGFSCPPHGMVIQGLVWEVFLEVRPHHERESAGVQAPRCAWSPYKTSYRGFNRHVPETPIKLVKKRKRQRKKHTPTNQKEWERSKRHAQASQGPKSEEG